MTAVASGYRCHAFQAIATNTFCAFTSKAYNGPQYCQHNVFYQLQYYQFTDSEFTMYSASQRQRLSLVAQLDSGNSRSSEVDQPVNGNISDTRQKFPTKNWGN